MRVDIGVNLFDDMFCGIYHGSQRHAEDLASVFDRACRVGINRMLLTSSCPADVHANHHLIQRFSGEKSASLHLGMTVGVHPCQASQWNRKEMLELLRKYEPFVEAFGEFGLDYDRLEYASREAQLETFRGQLQLYTEYHFGNKLPLFLHMRSACDDFIRIFADEHPAILTEIQIFASSKGTKGIAAVVHSFTDSVEVALRLVSAGFFIGIDGCSLRTEETCEAIRTSIPTERILVESDAPWCSIRPSFWANQAGFVPKWADIISFFDDASHAEAYEKPCEAKKFDPTRMVKSRNEPCETARVLHAVAHLKDISDIAEFAGVIYATSQKVFPKRK